MSKKLNDYLDEVLPICLDVGIGHRINLANVNNSSTGNNWYYEPFYSAYKTKEEAEKARLEIYKAIKLIKKLKI